MPTSPETLSLIKTTFFQINSYVQSSVSSHPKNKKTLEFAQQVLSEMPQYPLINAHKDLLIAHWEYITDDIRVSPLVFNLLFPSSSEYIPQIEEKIEQLLSAEKINTFGVFNLLKSFNGNGYNTLEIFLKILGKYGLTNPTISFEKAKAISHIFLYILEQFYNPASFIDIIARNTHCLPSSLNSISLALLNDFPWSSIKSSLDQFYGICFFRHFLPISPNNPYLKDELRKFFLIEPSGACRSILFALARRCKDSEEGAEIFTWISKNMPADIKKEVYSRRNEEGYTVLYDICRENSLFNLTAPSVWRKEFSISWHEPLKDILIHTKESFAHHVLLFPNSLCLALLEIQDELITPDLMKELDDSQVIRFLNLCAKKNKKNLFKKILNAWEFPIDKLKRYLKLSLTVPEQAKYAKYFLRKTTEIPGFTFSKQIFDQFEVASIETIFLFLRYAFINNDYAAQTHLSKFFQRCTESIEYQNQLKKYPTLALRIALIESISREDEQTFVATLHKLKFEGDDLRSLYFHLFSQEPPESLTYQILCMIVPKAMRLIKLELQIKNHYSNEALTQFIEVLNSSAVGLFLTYPGKYPTLVTCLSRIPNLPGILNKLDYNLENLISYTLISGLTDALSAIVKGDSEGEIEKTLIMGPENGGPLAWFTFVVTKDKGRAFIIMLEALCNRGLLSQTALGQLLNTEELWNYNELITKIFSFCLPIQQKEIIKKFRSQRDAPFLFEIVRRNNLELADLVISLLAEFTTREIEDVVLPSENFSLFHSITKENRSIFKKLLPLISDSLLSRAATSLSVSNYCCLASFGAAYACLTPRSSFPFILGYCIKENHDVALLNYLSAINAKKGGLNDIKIPIAYLLEMVNTVIDNPANKPCNHVIINCLLTQLAPTFLMIQELRLVNKLIQLDRDVEIIDWMSTQLRSEHSQKYFAAIRVTIYLRKLMFEAGNDSIKQFIRTLNLSQQEIREFLPFFPISTITTLKDSISEAEQKAIQAKRIYLFEQGHCNVITALHHTYETVAVPLQKALKAPASNLNTNEIRSAFKTIESFLLNITLDDLVVATPMVKEELSLFIPYFPRSHQIVFIPLLESDLLNTFLETQSLDKQAEYLQYASKAQKESFLKVVGLKHTHINSWKESKKMSESLCYNLLGIKTFLIKTLAILERALKNSEETSKLIQTGYAEFSTLVMETLESAKKYLADSKDLHPPEDFFDMITKDMMEAPVIITDKNHTSFIIDFSTLLMLRENPKLSLKFNLQDVKEHTDLKKRIEDWQKTHT